MAGVEFVITIFGAASGADMFLDTLRAQEQAGDLFLLDAVVVSKNSTGDVEIMETEDLQGTRGALLGAASGAVLGLLGGPVGALIGMAAGAAVGGAAAETVDTGVPDHMVDDFVINLKPGMSAFLALIEAPWLDRVQQAALAQQSLTQVKFWHHALSDAASETLKEKAKAKRKPKPGE